MSGIDDTAERVQQWLDAQAIRTPTADIASLIRTVQNQQDQIEALESLRPLWAQGFSTASQAAQGTGNALTQVWEFLGVTNQTAAMEALRELRALAHG